MKKYIIGGLIIAVLVVLYFFFLDSDENTKEILVKPQYGDFEIIVTSTGELRAKNSLEIKSEVNPRSVGIWRLKISKLIDEGTIVDSGDFVAELDKSEVTEKLNNKQLSVEKLESEFLQAKLDSALELSGARDNLENLKFELEEKKILKEQSQYEPPASIRQAEINYEKTMRSYNQSLKNYQTKVEKSIAKISAVFTDLQKERQGLDKLIRTVQGFKIFAPAPGMVIYKKEWDGRARTVGSEISGWDPTVATLPDLSIMESVTYINEVDIQKINTEQIVEVGLDANPDKKLTGKVTKVANIGEELRNSDSKVFQVIIQIDQSDSTLLPAMTTSNKIFVKTEKEALFIPLECIHEIEEEDSKIQYVYKKDNGSYIKQEVKTGELNENHIVIKEGLTQQDEIYMSLPNNSDEIEITLLKSNLEEESNE